MEREQVMNILEALGPLFLKQALLHEFPYFVTQWFSFSLV